MSRPLVLITGGAGFIGSNIAARLCEGGRYDVAVCDRLRAAESGKWRNLAKHPIVDVFAPEAMFDWLSAHAEALEAVVHMGAISSTTEADADKIIHTNFGLSRDLYRWCTDRQRRFIYASSAATYGDGAAGFDDAGGIAEYKRLRPLNLYGWSKHAFDLWAMREAAAERAPPLWIGLKFFNVFGPNEHHKGEMMSLVAKYWRRIADGEPIKLFKSHRPDYADGEQRRDFVYVKDCADAMVWLWRRDPDAGINGIYNLGTGEARTFLDLINATGAALGVAPQIEFIDIPPDIRPSYQYFTEAKMTRLRQAGYNAPFTSLEDAVRDTVAQYADPDPYL